MKNTKRILLILILNFIFLASFAQLKSNKKNFVLVHGAWHGGWCWKEVKDNLIKQNFNTYTPSLSGMAEHKHNLNDSISLQTHILDIINLIIMEDLQDVVLVGHSYAGAVITGVADSIPERLSKLIYLDAMLVHNGESPITSEPNAEQLKKIKTFRNKEHFDPISSSYFGVSDRTQMKWVNERLTPQPYMTFGQILELDHEFGNGIPLVYIACINPQLSVLKNRSDKLKNEKSWTYLTLNTGHDAMITQPNELSAMLIELAE
ncbi:alpha/beta fold hydrolase [Fulvivirga sediminis]|uniref:Alpha/beta fold hydrolase n=1 Tax=Fulvivirga sediminis TaxID=2803949 RepID=A0A937FBP8_9BACT|nr:alpha/beta fold hydrolase [Fulvivirga sediminis]MBL3659056.1 alpha/beta fold hydrolase [Fulvivirga sediminis]